MKREILKLKNERDTKIKSLEDLLKTVESQDDGYTDEQRTQRDDLVKEIEKLNDQIRDKENHEEAMRMVADGSAPSSEEVKELNKISKKYSLAKVVRALVNKQSLPREGVEAEMHQEADHEVKSAGNSLAGLGIPSKLIDFRSAARSRHQRADLEVATPATAGVLVDTELDRKVVPVLRPELQLVNMGVETRTGLTGNYSFVRKTTASTWGWASEKAVASETNPAYELITMTPNRITGFIPVTRRLMIQSDVNVEQDVRRDAELGIATTMDLGGINGSGASNQPTGILNIAGIGDVAGGTNGANPTYANIVNLKKELRVDNVRMENMAWLSNPDMEATLALTEKFSGTNGMPVLDDGKVFGYPFKVSTQVPNTLTKGTSNDCSAIILANWSEGIFAIWGGLDLIFDEITRAKEHMVQLIGHLLVDFNVRHVQSFAAMQDARAL